MLLNGLSRDNFFLISVKEIFPETAKASAELSIYVPANLRMCRQKLRNFSTTALLMVIYI